MEGRPPVPDVELVAAVVTGDVEAFAVLYDRYAQAVYRAAFRRSGDRQVAEEVLQDTYLALWNRAELFDASAGSLLVWLSTIARNRSVDRLRALGRRPAAVPLSAIAPADDRDEGAIERTMSRAALVGSGSPPVDPEQALEDAGLRAEVRDAIDTIPHLERQVIELAYYEELTQSEIAARLGWPLGTVKTRTRRALGRLREVLATRFGADLAPPSPPVAVAVESAAGDDGMRSSDGPR
jgi:RNA polymerase sigma-70 factor (ECF subfamily)